VVRNILPAEINKWSYPVPLSKKRKKKRPDNVAHSKANIQKNIKSNSDTAPDTTTKKKKISNQQILMYVFSVLVILSMVMGFLVGQSGPAVPTPTPQVELNSQATPTSADKKEADKSATPEQKGEASATPTTEQK